MGLEWVLRKLRSSPLRAVPQPPTRPSAHLQVLGAGQGRTLLGSESACWPLCPEGKTAWKTPRVYRP